MPTPRPDTGTTRIAVIGLSCRLPGARDPETFWGNLVAGVDSVRTLEPEELTAWGEDPAALEHPAYVASCGVVDDVECFDAAFFGYPPAVAQIMDPQQRVFLECAWHALESSGHGPRSDGLRVGVFAGSAVSQHSSMVWAQRDRIPDLDDYQLLLVNGPEGVATRTSYQLGLTGPSMGVQTACSTSLVAIHQACQALLDDECDMALAGGVSIPLPRSGYRYRAGGIGSPDGRCRPFDASANGIVTSEGVGVVVLRRLADAVADGDPVRAVVLGSAVNNDGADKLGFYAPSVDGQAEVVRLAHLAAGIDPGTITYVEAHGTGTALGDPVEIAALARAFRLSTDRSGFCSIGSVKGNVGHTNTAAGVTGFIKTVLCLERARVPATAHYCAPNPELGLADTPFRVSARLEEWPAGATPRRAGVSSFGIGGTNAHVVMEQASPAAPAGAGPAQQLLPISARSEAALGQMAADLAEHLRGHPEVELADVAFTLQVGRQAMPRRRFAVVADRERAIAALSDRRSDASEATARERPLTLLFPGFGAQHVGMGRELYETTAAFRTELDRCAELLRPVLDVDLRSLLYPSPEEAASAAERLPGPALGLPALVAVQHSLSRLCLHWGLTPSALLGHGAGELAAGVLAGALTLEDGLRLAAAWGRLAERSGAAVRLSVQLPEPEVRELLDGDLRLAAVDGPARCVVSGPEERVEAVRARLAERGTGTRRLPGRHALHSALLEPAPAGAGAVAAAPAAIPLVSGLSGGWFAADPGHWSRLLRETVRFGDGLATLFQEPDRVYLEVGPGGQLAAAANQHPGRPSDAAVVALLPDGPLEGSDRASALAAAGRLWLLGAPVAWANLHDGRRRRVPLPGYPFERQRHLVDLRHRELATAPPAAVAEPAAGAGDGGDVVPGLAILFQEVLGVPSVGPDDDFFELGGDSLIATRLLSRVQETFEVELPQATVFERPTVAELGAEIQSHRTDREGAAR
jgi:phthiocerol/phenolphthiocerol synthesis type-I polyketide synthase E